MKRLFVPAGLLLAVLSCGEESDWSLEGSGAGEVRSEIINGSICSEETAPAAVAILADMKVNIGGWSAQELRSVSCTGTLIAKDTVLTAAHCVDRELLEMSLGGVGTIEEINYYVSFTSDLSEFSTNPRAFMPVDAVKAKEWVGHPEFSMGSMTQVNGVGEFYDVGLLFLERPVMWVEPAVLISRAEAADIRVGAPVTIAGWGMQTAEGGSWGQPPPEGTVGVKVCAESSINEVGAAEIQIGSDANSSRKCHGDSGGPSFMRIETKTTRKERVVGITSHAYDHTDCYKGGVDSRVDVWLNWLNTEMERRCSDGTRVWCEVAGVIPATYYDPPPLEEPEGEEEGCACGQTSPVLPWGLIGIGGLFLGYRRRRLKAF